MALVPVDVRVVAVVKTQHPLARDLLNKNKSYGKKKRAFRLVCGGDSALP